MRRAPLQAVSRSSPAPDLARLVRSASRTSDRGLVIALVPPNDEQDFIAKAVKWLAEQNSPPDLILIRAADA
jgi:hypothetical protein